jgi:hypothetical protein
MEAASVAGQQPVFLAAEAGSIIFGMTAHNSTFRRLLEKFLLVLA